MATSDVRPAWRYGDIELVTGFYANQVRRYADWLGYTYSGSGKHIEYVHRDVEIMAAMHQIQGELTAGVRNAGVPYHVFDDAAAYFRAHLDATEYELVWPSGTRLVMTCPTLEHPRPTL